MPTTDLSLAAPEIFLTSAICVVLLVDVFLRDSQRNVTYVLSMLALIGTAAVTLHVSVDHRALAFGDLPQASHGRPLCRGRQASTTGCGRIRAQHQIA